MLRTSSINIQDTFTPQMVDKLLTNIAWVVHSTYHMVLNIMSGAVIFSRDVLFDIPCIADWNQIGKCRQSFVDQSCAKTNKFWIDFDYPMAKVLLTEKMVSSAN